jgi:hypothetical protein
VSSKVTKGNARACARPGCRSLAIEAIRDAGEEVGEQRLLHVTKRDDERLLFAISKTAGMAEEFDRHYHDKWAAAQV